MSPQLGLFYGSSSGNTEEVAEIIRERLGDELQVFMNIADADPEDLQNCDALILGVSTWEDGQLQEDWDIFFPDFDDIDFSGRKVALFGLGDGKCHSGKFVNALRILYDKVVERGAHVVGAWPIEGYRCAFSSAIVEGRFVGLVLDRDNQDKQTAPRVEEWLNQVIPLLRE